MDHALLHGSSIGGAHPKALIEQGDRKFVAKFSAKNDTYAVVKAEYVAMRVGRVAGLDMAPVELASAGKKDVLLVERFERAWTPPHAHPTGKRIVDTGVEHACTLDAPGWPQKHP